MREGERAHHEIDAAGLDREGVQIAEAELGAREADPRLLKHLGNGIHSGHAMAACGQPAGMASRAACGIQGIAGGQRLD